MTDKKKLLILIVAYNHEKFIENVLGRIDKKLNEKYYVEILINDDSSSDRTLEITKNFIEKNNKEKKFKYNILSNPVNQGYGGNQKIGFLYAKKNNFDYVALLHGDGQYAPECLEDLVEPLNSDDVDAVFGSRMINKGGALKGGMPLYKYVGNKILTFFQNKLFNKNFSEFHSGYRVYKVSSIQKIPYELNSNDHSFDNQIIIQFLLSNLNIKEIPIPTYYGEEISYVNGFKYAYQVFVANIKAKLQKLGIFYDRKFDCVANEIENYHFKDYFDSPHKRVLSEIKDNSKILDLGCNNVQLGMLLEKNKNCSVTGVDKKKLDKNLINKYICYDLDNGLPDINYEEFDYILLLDVIEHLKEPELFMKKLKNKFISNNKTKILISTPNIGFFVIRFMLLFGYFNYGKKGILDKTHTRLFTFSTFKNLIEQSDYLIKKTSGIPAPFPLAIGYNFLSKFLLEINSILIKFFKSFFSYQIYCEIKPRVSLEFLLEQAKKHVEKK